MPDSSSKTLLIIVPTFNEKENIENLLNRILSETSAHILIVDDASPDGTGAIVTKMMKKSDRIALISREKKLGLGTAYIAGMKYGLSKPFSYIGGMDADFSHDPSYISLMLNRIHTENIDLIIGSRYIQGGGVQYCTPWRKFISYTANFLARIIINNTIKDNTSGFRIYRADLLKLIDLDAITSDGYSFLVELVFLCKRENAVMAEHPIIFVNRQYGSSKISQVEIFKAIKTLMTLFFMKFSRKV